MRVKGFGNFIPENYTQRTVQNDGNAPLNQNNGAPEASTTSAAPPIRPPSPRQSTLEKIKALEKKNAHERMKTRMRSPERPVRDLDDAKSRYLVQDPEEVSETFEDLQEAATKHNAFDDETVRLMGQAAMELVNPHLDHQPLEGGAPAPPLANVAQLLNGAPAMQNIFQFLNNNNDERLRHQVNALLAQGLAPEDIFRLLNGNR